MDIDLHYLCFSEAEKVSLSIRLFSVDDPIST